MSAPELHDLLNQVAERWDPPDLLPTVARRVRRKRQQRVLGTIAVVAVLVSGVIAGALTISGGSTSSISPTNGFVGSGATDRQIEGVAQRYFEQNTHSAHTKLLGIRRGSECTAVVLQTTEGQTAGVAVVLQGQPPPQWQAVGMSSAYTLQRFVDSGDSLCNLASILNTRAGHTAPPLTFGTNGHIPH
jgi:hypothetical protein